MNAQELRIGNLLDRQDYIVKVVEIRSDGVITAPLRYVGERFVVERLEPIPITDEWLFRLGFIDGWMTIGSQEIYININLGQFNLHGYDSCTSGTCFCGYIKYVHQLQNLYFALTGNELTYE